MPPVRQLILGAVLTWVAAGGPRATQAAEAVRVGAEITRQLHEGRFAAAEEGLGPEGSDAPDVAFFRAFATYWRLLYDEDNPQLKVRFERQLQAAFAATEKIPSAAGSEGLFWAGSARLLLAQLRASEKHPFAAAKEARRAKHLLEQALDAGAPRADAEFFLGTYNYMADRVPAFVKGFRAIFFLPRGDREKGLRQLLNAAQASQWFRLEARVLLAGIYANKHERLYLEALHQVQALCDEFPETVAAFHAAARIELSLGFERRTIEKLDHALAWVARTPGVAPEVEQTLRFQRARAEFSRFRPHLCARWLRSILEGPIPLPAKLQSEARQLLTEATALADGSFRRAEAALDQLDKAPSAENRSRLLQLARESGGDPVLLALAGRAQLEAGNPLEALPLLLKAERSSALPAAWLGYCRLLVGRALDLKGERDPAKTHYRLAAEGPSFIMRDAAWYHLGTPYAGLP